MRLLHTTPDDHIISDNEFSLNATPGFGDHDASFDVYSDHSGGVQLVNDKFTLSFEKHELKLMKKVSKDDRR